jgi:hypothetical protein
VTPLATWDGGGGWALDTGAPSLLRWAAAIRAAGRNLPPWSRARPADRVPNANARNEPMHPEDAALLRQGGRYAMLHFIEAGVAP